MNRPRVTIATTTYFPPGPDGILRKDTFETALNSWGRHLRYAGEIHLHVADDGSYDHVQFGVSPFPFTLSRQDRHGVGASLNRGMEIAFEPDGLALHTPDDWILNYDFDLTPWADLLMEREDIGMVRFFPHPWLTGKIEHDAGRWFVRLNRHGFAAATRPFLLHKRFIDTYGWFKEDVNAFDCEIDLGVRFVGHNAHRRECLERTTNSGVEMLTVPGGRNIYDCMLDDGCNDESTRGPGIVLALPSPWDHLEGVELGDINPLE